METTKIDDGCYQGYYWMSDETQPHIIENGSLPEQIKLAAGSNPFVIEAQLFCNKNNTSYSIKYIDGKYIIRKFDLNELANISHDELAFNSHRMDGKILKFHRYWHEADDSDNLLCGMKTLEPKELVFIGFEK